MTVMRRTSNRFTIESLLRPGSVAVIGADTPDGRLLAANLRNGGFEGPVHLVDSGSPAADAAQGCRAIADLPDIPDLALVAAPAAQVPDLLAALAKRGAFAAIVTTHVSDLAAIARKAGIRVLGPRSFGIAAPRLGLNASLSHMQLPSGRVALITQSASLTRAVVDWAGPNGVGFSHVVGIGGNTDIGFGRVLDWLSRDPGTGLIMIDIRQVRERRAFISAARAASRLRPVVALRPGGRLIDPSGRSDAVFAAALRRAGVFVVSGLESFLAAAEVLSRARPLRGDAMAVITNAIGPGRLAADAALNAGISLAVLPPHAREVLAGTMPAEMTQGLIYASSADPIAIADIAAMVSAVPEVGGVLVMLAPTGPADAAAIEAVIAAASAARLPVLSCVMGETSGAAYRRRLADAGLPAFATPELAVQAFGHLLRDRRAREAARELPPDRVLALLPDHTGVHAIIREARAAGRLALSREAALRILAAYGFETAPSAAATTATQQAHTPAPKLATAVASIRVHDDAMFGPAIGVSTAHSAVPAYDLPPLNLPLALDLATRGGIEAPFADTAAISLVRISQLLVDEPEIASLGIDRLELTTGGATIDAAAIWLRPPGERAVLAIPPYPEQLAETWTAHPSSSTAAAPTFTIRPIRPEDAAAHAALVGRVPVEDLRYRFFTAMRKVAPEQMVRLTQIDYEREMAFIAVREHDHATVGVARLVREFDANLAEFAILVEPACKGIGLASHLMQRLIDWGRDQGIRRITGQILTDNAPMLRFIRHLGFVVHATPGEPDVMEASLELKPAAPPSSRTAATLDPPL